MNDTPMPTGYVTTMPTIELYENILAWLADKEPEVECEFFPDNPLKYRLNHPIGAYLLSHQGSRFGNPIDTFSVIQDRQVMLAFNIIARQLYGRDGAIGMCDRLRDALVGYQPPSCDRKIWANSEQFLGEEDGLWLYQVTLSTQTVSLPKIF